METGPWPVFSPLLIRSKKTLRHLPASKYMGSNMHIASRWEISVSSSCCSSSSTLRWEWSSLANWVSHTIGRKHIQTYTAVYKLQQKKLFESTHHYHSHELQQISLPELSLLNPHSLPPSVSLSLFLSTTLTSEPCLLP